MLKIYTCFDVSQCWLTKIPSEIGNHKWQILSLFKERRLSILELSGRVHVMCAFVLLLLNLVSDCCWHNNAGHFVKRYLLDMSTKSLRTTCRASNTSCHSKVNNIPLPLLDIHLMAVAAQGGRIYVKGLRDRH